MAHALVLVLLLVTQGSEPLQVGATVEGKLTTADPKVRTERITEAFGHLAVHGHDYWLVVDRAGPVTIDLHSHFFDAYLVVRKPDGGVVAEDDNGMLLTHARVVTTLEPGRYRISACGLGDDAGSFTLRIRSGRPKPIWGPAREALELEDAKRTVEVLEREFGKDHERVATGLNQLGYVLWRLGRPQDALPVMRRVLAIVRKCFGEEHPRVAHAWFELAAQVGALHQWQPAEQMYRKALAVYEKTLGEDDPEVAMTLNNLVRLLETEGRPREAEPLSRRAFAIARRHRRDKELLLNSACCLAACLRDTGGSAEAERLLRRAIKGYAKLYGPEHPSVLVTRADLARVLAISGREQEAEKLFRQVLSGYEAHFPDHAMRMASLCRDLAACLERRRQHKEAVALCRRALELDAKHGGNHPEVAESEHELGKTLAEWGRFDEAETHLRRAVALRQELVGATHPLTGESLRCLSEVLARTGKLDEAARLLRRGLSIAQTRIGGGRAETCSALHELVHVEADLGRPSRAFAAATRYCDDGFEWMLDALVSEGVDRRLRAAFAHRNRLDHLLSSLRALDVSRSRGAAAYERVCAWKAVMARHVLRSDIDVPRLRAATKSTRDRWLDLAGAVRNFARDEWNHYSRKEYRRVVLLAKQRGLLAKQLRAAYGISVGSDLGERLADVLPDGSAVLDFFVHEPVPLAGRKLDPDNRWVSRHEPRVLCWVTRSGDRGPTLVELGTAAEVESAVGDYLRWLSDRDGREEGAFERSSAAVRNAVWKPLASYLNGVSRVFVIPDGRLTYLPFAALPIDDGKFLVENAEIVYAGDPQTLSEHLSVHRSRQVDRAKLLAVGSVDYDKRAQDAATEQKRGSHARVTEATWPALPGAGDELAAVTGLHRRVFGEKSHVSVLRGLDAGESRVAHKAPGNGVLHFATRVFYDRPNRAPLAMTGVGPTLRASGCFGTSLPPRSEGRTRLGELSGLALTGANLAPAGTLDGILVDGEIAHLELDACEVVVVSACDPLRTDDRTGEGPSSMRRAFADAGAANVVLPMWQADPATTRRLLVGFYEHLWKHGGSAATALRSAQLAILRDSAVRDPHDWGGFTVFVGR